MQIFFIIELERYHNKTYTLDVEPSDTIAIVKAKIENKMNVPVCWQRLYRRFGTRMYIELEDDRKLSEYYIQKGHLLRLVPRLEDTSKKNTSTLFTVRLNTFHAGDEIEAWGPVTLYEAQRRTIDHYPRCAGFSYNQKKQMAFFHHSIDGGKIRHEGNKHRTGIPVEDFNLYLRIPDPFYKQ